MSTGFSERLSELRQENNIPQRTAAQDLGISQALLSHYENGIREPRFAFVVKACEYYGVSADYILGRTDTRVNPMLSTGSGAEQESGSVRTYRFTNALSVLFAFLAERAGDKSAGLASKYLGYPLYRLYCELIYAQKDEIELFKMRAMCDVAMKMTEAEFVAELMKIDTSDITPDSLREAYPEESKAFLDSLETIRKELYSGIEKMIQ